MNYDDSRPLLPSLMVPTLSYLNLPEDTLLNIEQFLSLADIMEMIRLAEPHIWHPQDHEVFDDGDPFWIIE